MPRVSSHRSHGSHPYRQSWSPAPASTGHTYSSPSSAPHFLSSAEVINSSCTAVSSSNLPQPELYPYQKGKKVTTSQLDQLLAYFAKNDNPTKEERTILASEVQMWAASFPLSKIRFLQRDAFEFVCDESLMTPLLIGLSKLSPYGFKTNGLMSRKVAVVQQAHYPLTPPHRLSRSIQTTGNLRLHAPLPNRLLPNLPNLG